MTEEEHRYGLREIRSAQGWDRIKVIVRGKSYDAVVTKMPFVPTKYYKPS